MKILSKDGLVIDFAQAAASAEPTSRLLVKLRHDGPMLATTTLDNYRQAIPYIATALIAAAKVLGREAPASRDDIDSQLVMAFAEQLTFRIADGAKQSTVDNHYRLACTLFTLAAGDRVIRIPKHRFSAPSTPPKLPPDAVIDQLDQAIRSFEETWSTQEPTYRDLGMVILAILRLTGLNLSAIARLNGASIVEVIETNEPVLIQEKPRAGQAVILLGVPAENLDRVAALLEQYARAAERIRHHLPGAPFWAYRGKFDQVRTLTAAPNQFFRDLLVATLKRLNLEDHSRAIARKLRLVAQREHVLANPDGPIDRHGHTDPGGAAAQPYLRSSITDTEHYAILNAVAEQLFQGDSA